MTKEELKALTMPLSQKDYERLKLAMDMGTIERPDIPKEIRRELDKRMAEERKEEYFRLLKDGTFGPYD